jgi:hypothetical protein
VTTRLYEAFAASGKMLTAMNIAVSELLDSAEMPVDAGDAE